MTIRIATNVAVLQARTMLDHQQHQADAAARHLATGLRIVTAADDASGVTLTAHLTSGLDGLVQASANTTDALAVAGIADGALSVAADTLQSMRRLVLRAANAGATDTAARQAIAGQIGALTELLDAIAEFTSSGRTPLLDGTYRGVFQVGPDGGDTVILDLTGADLHAATFTGGADLKHLAVADDTDGIYTVDGLRADLAALTKSITAVTATRSTIGAVTDGLHATWQRLGQAIGSVTAARSTIADADMGAEATSYVAARIRGNAAAAVLAQANSQPAAVLRLLDGAAQGRHRQHTSGSAAGDGTGRSPGASSGGGSGSGGAPASGEADARAGGSVRSRGTHRATAGDGDRGGRTDDGAARGLRAGSGAIAESGPATRTAPLTEPATRPAAEGSTGGGLPPTDNERREPAAEPARRRDALPAGGRPAAAPGG